MKMIQLFRKPCLSMFFASFILLISCSKYEVNEDPPQPMDANTLKNTHQLIKHKLHHAQEATNPFEGGHLISLEYEKAYLDNLNYLNENGLEALFERSGIEVKVLDEIEFYLAHESNEEVYQLMVDNFQIEDGEEAAFLFNLIEVYYQVLDGLELDKKGALSEDEVQRLPWACVIAIAGTIATTAGAAFISGGAALIVFLISKGIATAAIIQACT